MRGRALRLVVGLGLLAVGGSGVRAEGLRDLADGWLLGPAALAGVLDGAPGGRAPAGAWAWAGSMRLHGLDDLPVVGAAAGARPAGRWLPGVAVRWEVLEGPLFRAEFRRLDAWWGRTTAVGVAWRERRRRWGGAEGFAVTVETAAAARLVVRHVRGGPGAGLRGEVEWWPTEGVAAPEPRRRLGRLEAWRGTWAVAVACDAGPDGAPTLAGEAWFAAAGLACGWRLDPATGAAGLLLGWRAGPLLLRTSHLAHPALGTTHRVALGLGRWEAAPW